MRFKSAGNTSAPRLARPSRASATILGALRPLVRAFAACSRAAISPLTALMLIPLSGAIAYSVELGSWQYMQRSMQNAADAAALAAAINNNSTTLDSDPSSAPYYRVEARAAARQFGFVDGQGNTTVTADRTNCPAGTQSGVTCYSATVTTKFPLLFSGVIGFTGDTTYGSGRGQSILASAIATTAGGSTGTLTSPCIWAFTDLDTSGTPNADLTGCSVLANKAMKCSGNGHQTGLKAEYAIAGTSLSGGCAANNDNEFTDGSLIPADPYANLKNNIPTSASPTCPASTLKSGSITSTCLFYSGGLALNGNYTITKPNTVIVVKDGPLNLNGNILSTSGTGSVTIVLAGTGAGITGKKNDQGVINIRAPDKDSGSAWKGVAIYQDPNAALVDTEISGAKKQNGVPQAWTITGLVYLPRSNVTVTGAVNHFATGATCMVLVANAVTVKGGGSLLQAPTGCDVAGLTQLPTVTIGGGTLTRQKLVQ